MATELLNRCLKRWQIMRSFNCLDPSTKLYTHTLVEASAGTGKTFAIEHLVVRFVLDGIPIESILVVTFTIAATKELRQRIGSCLSSALLALKEQNSAGIAYLQALINLDSESRFKASLLLEKALLDLEQASICTIHSFCFKALDKAGRIYAELAEDESVDYKGFFLSKIKQLLNTGSLKEAILPASFARLVKAHQFSFDKLYSALIEHIASSSSKEPLYNLVDLSRALKKEVSVLKNLLPVEVEALMDFKGLFSKEKQLKPTFKEQINALAGKSFDDVLQVLVGEKESLIPLLSAANLKKGKALDSALEEMEQSAQRLWKHLEKLRDTRVTFLQLASYCKCHIEKDPASYSHYSPDHLIVSMKKAVEEEAFVEEVASNFDVAIIDEFQDTDGSQWDIFSALFVKRRAKALFLVGDPKQSIYSFRKADLSIFYQAKKQVDEVVYLDTNYRSSVPLQNALNAMFSHTPSWLDSPTIELPFVEVKAGGSNEVSSLHDGKKEIHFPLYKASSKGKKTWPSSDIESEVIFPFLAREVAQLNQEGIAFEKMAILIKDRFALSRLSSYFTSCQIPFKVQRAGSLFETAAFDFFSQLIIAIAEEGKEGSLEAVMMHCFISSPCSDHRVQISAVNWKTFFIRAHRLWIESGFYKAMAFLMSEPINGQVDLAQLFHIKGLTYHFMQISSSLDQCYALFKQHVVSPNRMKTFLVTESHHFLTLEKVQVPRGGGRGVALMTTFMSKGLEFDVVFPIDLMHRKSGKTTFVRIHGRQEPFDPDNHEHLRQLEEEKAERLRQLYVAMTRAKKRLYLPFVVDEAIEGVVQARRSSLELFLPSSDLEGFIKKIGASFHYLEKSSLPKPLSLKKNIGPEKKKCALDATLLQPRYIESFSSLAQPPSFEVEKLFVEETGLPPGKKTGTFLHFILEQMIREKHYRQVGSKASKAWLKHCVQNSDYSEHLSEIEAIVQAVFTFPILKTPLEKLAAENLCPELSFTFKEKEIALTGFIDLVVLMDKKVFIIDWKSNTLPGYKKSDLVKEVAHHQYDLQARIYRAALLQSLRGKGLNLSFGGTYYVFLRGLKENQGVIKL